MFRRLFVLVLFALTGCTEANTVFPIHTNTGTVLKATCYMSNFKDFPEKVSGPVTLELNSFITILVENEDRSEKIEIAFHKSKCKYGK